MLIAVITSFITTIGFSIMFNLPRKLLIHTGITGSLGFFAYKIIANVTKDYILASLLGAVVVGVIGQIFAANTKHPSTLFTVPGIIPLVPGYQLYNTMYYLVQKDTTTAAGHGIDAVFLSVSIACGIAVSTTVMLRFKPELNRFFRKRESNK